jgi:hypothetical protein
MDRIGKSLLLRPIELRRLSRKSRSMHPVEALFVILHETLERDAVETAAGYPHTLRELIRRFENGIGNRDGSFHT